MVNPEGDFPSKYKKLDCDEASKILIPVNGEYTLIVKSDNWLVSYQLTIIIKLVPGA